MISAVSYSTRKRVFFGGWVGGPLSFVHNSSYLLQQLLQFPARLKKNILFYEIIYFFSRLHFVNSSFSSMLSPSKIIEVPKHFCELDRREECKAGECLRYDPKKFR